MLLKQKWKKERFISSDHSSQNLSEVESKQMLGFLWHFLCSCRWSGLLMGTNCAPLLKKLFYMHTRRFLFKSLRRKKTPLAVALNSTFGYQRFYLFNIDQNHSYVDSIYSRKIWKFFFNLETQQNGFPYNGSTLQWATPGNHDFIKFDSALCQKASIQVYNI
jgi:hypothetical protein